MYTSRHIEHDMKCGELLTVHGRSLAEVSCIRLFFSFIISFDNPRATIYLEHFVYIGTIFVFYYSKVGLIKCFYCIEQHEGCPLAFASTSPLLINFVVNPANFCAALLRRMFGGTTCVCIIVVTPADGIPSSNNVTSSHPSRTLPK